MPYEMRRTSRRTPQGKRSCYYVRNKVTKRKFAKCTSLVNARKQLRLLRAVMYNPDFVPYTRRHYADRDAGK